MSLLEIRDLNISFYDKNRPILAIKDMNLDLDRQESICIVGESGSGKSVLAESILGLHDSAHVSGSIKFKGRDILKMSECDIQNIRGKEVCLIPQNASQSWNPMMRLGKQMEEFLVKCGKDREEAQKSLMATMRGCGLDTGLTREYPHRLSGGMSQRAMIAMCMAAEPDLLIADEPTKGLDNRCKEEVLNIMSSIREDHSLIMITHDLSASRICERLAVLYGGSIMEMGATNDVLHQPLHPYTKGLIGAHPRNGMVPIPGNGERPKVKGCSYVSRCCHSHDSCSQDIHLHDRDGRHVRCCHDHD